LVFTSQDIAAACPDMASIPGAINGFGLLQAVQHFGLSGKTVTFNFLHQTIQEYLAAHYIITDLQQDEVLHLLNEKFWSDLHANMFAIYVMLTKGQQPCFKKFLSGGDDEVSISSAFLCNQVKCLRLCRCFHEANDTKMCITIEEATIFHYTEINLGNTSLSATDLECLCIFLISSSHKEWVRLNLYSCHIQDHGLHILHKYLNQSGITIYTLWLSHNGLSRSSSSLIKDIVLSCKVQGLWLNGNHTVGEREELYMMISHSSSMLMVLDMEDTHLSSAASQGLFRAVKEADMLMELYIHHNNITDDAVAGIASTLSLNKSLVKLGMRGNPISRKTIPLLLQSLIGNNTLQMLVIPRYDPPLEDVIKSTVREINQYQRNQRNLVVHWW